MGATRYIRDPKTGYFARIGEEGELSVVVHPHPPANEDVFPLPFIQSFTDDGSSTGSADMVVDGSVNYVDFYINARQDRTIYIKNITVQISDVNARLDRFGAQTALTNGVRFFYEDKKAGELVIQEAIKINLEFFSVANGGKEFGTGTDSWKADIAGGGGLDTYFPSYDTSIIFGMPWGIKLVKGTTDRIVMRVRDAITVDVFTVTGLGSQTLT